MKSDLKAVTSGLDVLEKQFGADNQESLAAVDTLMENFGMSATEAMDYLIAGYQNNLDYSGEFVYSISRYIQRISRKWDCRVKNFSTR